MQIPVDPRIATLIGSRKAPFSILSLATLIGRKLNALGCVCRSGAAEGMDSAFEAGFDLELREIYQPWKNFRKKTDNKYYIAKYDPEKELLAKKIASKIHPRWTILKDSHKRLHTRNVYQVVGFNLNLKSDLLICYAPPDGESVSGGTHTAYELAKRLNIPCFNLYDIDTRNQFINWIKS